MKKRENMGIVETSRPETGVWGRLGFHPFPPSPHFGAIRKARQALGMALPQKTTSTLDFIAMFTTCACAIVSAAAWDMEPREEIIIG